MKLIDIWDYISSRKGKEVIYPLSSSNEPKQFLKIINENSFLVNTVERIKLLINNKNIYVISNENYKEKIFGEIRDSKEENIFIEPYNKETPY